MFNKKNTFISVCCIIVLGIIILPMAGSGLFANNNSDTGISSQLCGPGFRLPFKNQDWNKKISSGFGENINPFTGEKYFHKGIDIPLKVGTPILASADGIVLKTSNNTDKNIISGKYIIIGHQGEFITGYYKLDRIICMPDQKIKSGEIIGYSGNTGLSTGPHLHFEIRKDREPVNPEICINF